MLNQQNQSDACVTTAPQIPDWLNEEGVATLGRGYLIQGETPRGMHERLSGYAAKILKRPDLEEDFFEIFWRGWLGPATPVASNFGTNRGLPISCYSVHVEDSVNSIYSHLKEVAQLSKHGGGVGIYLGDVRPAGSPISSGGKSTGIVPWAQQYDLASRVVSQGGVRRGSFAVYLPIDHPDVAELLQSKDHSKGDPRRFVDSNIGLTITDAWIESMIAGDQQKQELFSEVLKTRLISGSPYLVFIDNVNRQNPECYRERGLEVSTSNLCSEITLFTDDNHSFVCVLSSLNLARYDEWRDWRGQSGLSVPELSTYFLDAVVEDFIHKASRITSMGRAVRFAQKSRALGLGTMGLHLLYQKRGLPFASEGARQLNLEVHEFINAKATAASKQLACDYGEPEWCVGTGYRNSHLLAIAPTRTNSVISGAFSQGIEPVDANYFVAKQSKGTFIRKNPVLEELFCEKGVPESVWESILDARGSVQHLDFLSEEEKDVFKTAREIDQFELIKQAADRTPFICQAQSLNLFVDPEIEAEDLVRLHLTAWANGVKSLYYLRSTSLVAKRDTRPRAKIITKDDCPWCVKLKEQLASDGVTFEEVDRAKVDHFPYATVPQLWLDWRHIGGYSEYMEAKHAIKTEDTECEACQG
jgi:ribonucleoside-diphosphate reductase alpha chain